MSVSLEPSVKICEFLENLYGEEPLKIKKKTNTIYLPPKVNSIYVDVDKYGSCRIVVPQASSIPANMQKEISKLSQYVSDTSAFNSIWINVELPNKANIFAMCPDDWEIGNPGKGNFISDTQSNPQILSIWKWFNPKKECSLPPGATHNVGASAAVIDSICDKILLVQSDRRKDAWCMPRGNFDPLKDDKFSTSSTAKRECLKKTGIDLKDISGVQIGEIDFPENELAPALNMVWKFKLDGGSHIFPTYTTKEILRVNWVPFSRVRSGSYEGLEIGKEVQAAIDAQGGFVKLASSIATKQLNFA